MDLAYSPFKNLSNIREYQKIKHEIFHLYLYKFAGTSEKLKVHGLKYLSTKFGTFITICTILRFSGS